MPNQYTKARDEGSTAVADPAEQTQRPIEQAPDPAAADGEIDDTPQGAGARALRVDDADDTPAEVSAVEMGSESYDTFFEQLRAVHHQEERLLMLGKRFQSGEFLEKTDRDELLQGLPTYKRVPVFNPAPTKDEPRRRLINLNLLETPEDRLEWLRLQGRVVINIPLDPFEAAKVQDPTNPTQRIGTHVQWNGIIWPAAKGRPIRMPWPIAEMFYASPMGEYQAPVDVEEDPY